MKNKPLKHKSTNTFKFLPFAERISGIDIRHSALYYVDHSNADQPKELQTFFNLAIKKWNLLNLTGGYKEFRKLFQEIITLPQLIHKKDEVIKVLLEKLEDKNASYLQPMLEIVVALAKDLRDEFYHYFPRIFEVVVDLLSTKDAEQLEWTLVCLAFLFKILRPYLKKDITVILKNLLPLLSESKPDYIVNFAAESFAFVARDIKDKKNFVILLLKYAKVSDNDAIVGCGRLLFEIIRGAKGHFHSCAEEFLHLLMISLRDVRLPRELLFEIVTQMIADILYSIDVRFSDLLWKTLIKVVEEELELWNAKKTTDDAKSLEYVLRLSGQALEFRNGYFLQDVNPLIRLLIKLSGFKEFSPNILKIVVKLGSLLLLSAKFNLEQELTARLIRKILSLPNADILTDFVVGVVEYPQFEIMVLPHFLEFIAQADFEESALVALAKICLMKSPLSKNGCNLFSWVKYPIDFGPVTNKFSETLLSMIQFENISEVISRPEKLMVALICLPHLKIIQEAQCFQLLKIQTTKFLDEIRINTNERELQILVFLLASVIECSVHLGAWKDQETMCDLSVVLEVLMPLSTNPGLLGALQLVDLCVTAFDADHPIPFEVIKEMHGTLRKNLSSPFHEMRLYTTHIYSVCEKTLTQKISNDENEPLIAFSLAYGVESLKPSIQDYREQIAKLQRIAFGTQQFEIIKDSEFRTYALEYMFGALYINFKLLWSPISDLIAGYASGLHADEFWKIFHPILNRATDDSLANPSDSDSFVHFEDCDFLTTIYESYYRVDRKVDYVNYRILIWQAMEGFVPVCEARNRDVTTLFLSFIEDEFKRTQVQNTLLMDVKKFDETETAETIDDPDGESAGIHGKLLFKILVAQLKLFSKVKNPRALYKEPSLREIYLDFLKSQNSLIQKLALDCIMTYKSKNLIPYKNNLYNMVNDKKLKEELVAFRVDKDNENIIEEHREELIAILMRVLYGKMVSKVHSEKKGGGQMRRSLVLRYLAGCGQDELLVFNKMAFGFLDEYLALEVADIREKIRSSFNLKTMVKPKRLQSALNLVEVMRENFGGYMGDIMLPQLLKVVYCCSTMVGLAFENAEHVHVGYIEIMKKLRVQCMKIFTSFFIQFEKFEWSSAELLIIYDYIIWPLVTRLPMEGIHSPTALLKLFSAWSQNPRYYVLLNTRNPNDDAVTPLPFIFKLLLAPKTQTSVIAVITKMLENLLTLKEDTNESDHRTFASFNSVPIDSATIESLKLSEELNFGSKILLPFVPDILEFLKRKIKLKSKSGGIGKPELLILSRVTELVSTPETCDSLLGLLLTVLIKKVASGTGEETVEQSIQTISNLVKKSATPSKYIKAMAPLFSTVAPSNTRKLLIALLETIVGENDSDNIYAVVKELNAYDKRWIDQPDFDRRLNAYKTIYNLLESDKISADLSVLIIHNCFYSIKNENDLSLRDSAGQCLRKLCPKLTLKFSRTSDANYVIRETIIQLVITTIKKSDKDIVKNEAVSLLGELARCCTDADVVFRDLAPLCDEDDREVDFFDNMTHMQSHRKGRALLKFCAVMKKMKWTPAPKTLSQIILPLASEFLCNEKFASKNSLVDAAVDAVAVCCRLLPWHQYETILKFYLSRLRSSVEYQKQLIRLIIVILDNFHFDFSKAQLCDTVITETPIIEKNDDVEMDSDTELPKDVNNIADVLEDTNDLNNDETENMEVIGKSDAVESVKLLAAFDRVVILSPSAAKRTLESISVGLLIELRESISQLSTHEGSHKINRKKTSFDREQEEILKVPIALALVKLLQRLPDPLLANNLPGVFTKLCIFLKTPLRQVRMVARDIVKKIMNTIGSKYFGVLLYHLKLLLTRGYQVHVLVATMHDVLECLKSKFTKGDIDEHLPGILDICMNDLFGELSEEKEVDKIVGKTPEAKASKKSYVTLNILAQNISEENIVSLVIPFKELLLKTNSKKTVTRIQDCFLQFVQGLTVNTFVPIDALLKFLHGLVSETIQDLVPAETNVEVSEADREKLMRAKPDCFIIPAVPKRQREMLKISVRSSAKTNAPVLVEFGFSLLHLLLKREKLKGVDTKAFMDPIIPILNEALKNSHLKVIVSALKCLTSIWISKFSLPQLEKLIKEIAQTIFGILHKYAVSGLTKSNENHLLVHSAFKAVTALVRHVTYYTVDTKQLKALLLYAEQDMHGFERQSTAFTLLKTILDAKLISPVVHQVMGKVASISITSDAPKTREEARLIFLNYLMNYPLGNQIIKHLQFFTSQLNFDLDYGRESAFKMLGMIISKFPLESLSEQAGFLFTALGASLVDDMSPACKELSAQCIESLIERLDMPGKDKLFDLTMVFFNDSKAAHCEMGALLASRFVSVEAENFKDRLPALFPGISSQIFHLQIKVGGFVRLESDAENPEHNQKQKERDHALIQLLILLEKICSVCTGVFSSGKFTEELDDVADHCHTLLAHPHVWVRLKAVKVLGLLLDSPDLELLKKCIEEKSESNRKFIYRDTGDTLKKLVLDLCFQLIPAQVSQEMANEVTNALMKIVAIVNSIPSFSIPKTEEEKEDKCISVIWIINRLRLKMNTEMATASMSTVIRSSILNMLILIVNHLEIEDLRLMLPSIILTLVREMTNSNDSLSDIRQVAGRLAKKIRRRLGDVEFNDMVAKAQMDLNAKRAERRKVLVQEKVHNPERALKRKQHVKEKKSKQKKQKMDIMKGRKPGKRKRAAESDDEF